MRNKKFLIFWSLVFVVILGISLARFLDNSEAQGQLTNLPIDFNWKTYLQNYEDLRLAGIDTEEKAKRHWLEYGKNEGRDYHILRRAKLPEPVSETPKMSARPSVAAPVEAARSLAAAHLATSGSVSRTSLVPPKFDPVSFRKRFDTALENTGVKTKEEAIDYSLAFWEKRRKAYFS